MFNKYLATQAVCHLLIKTQDMEQKLSPIGFTLIDSIYTVEEVLSFLNQFLEFENFKFLPQETQNKLEMFIRYSQTSDIYLLGSTLIKGLKKAKDVDILLINKLPMKKHIKLGINLCDTHLDINIFSSQPQSNQNSYYYFAIGRTIRESVVGKAILCPLKHTFLFDNFYKSFY